MQLEEEGCLSVPGFNATVVRPARAVVKGLDRLGRGAAARRDRPAGARLSARDGSSRRHALRRPPARDQARPHRARRSASWRAPASGDTTARFASCSSARRRSRCRRSTRSSPRGTWWRASSRSPIGRAGGATARRDAPVKVRAREAGLPILQPTALKAPEFLAALTAARAPTSALSPPTAAFSPTPSSRSRGSG